MSRVAVVDDEASVRELVEAILVCRGYEVSSYATYVEARAALSASPPDLLITDVRLPDGDGLELVAKLHQSGVAVPAIVLSGMSEENDIVRGFESGAVDYLAKPFSPAELLARASVHLNRAKSTRKKPAQDDEAAGIPLRDGLAFGRYRIDKQLGRGGAGVVYRAYDTGANDELVALKVLLANADEEARLRFLRETYALSAVKHRRIIQIRDLGSSQGRLYYAMELVEGETLRARVDREGPITEEQALPLLRGLAEALAVIEDAGILHRDLKPDNIILRGGDLSKPVLVDFGLAKRRFDRGVTSAEFLVGTLGYIPPEVIKGQDPDRRSDLFALGLTIRAALTGEEVFPHLAGNDLLLAIAAGPIPGPDADLSRPFAKLLERLVACDVEKRPASARDLLQQVDLIGPRPTARPRRPERASLERDTG